MPPDGSSKSPGIQTNRGVSVKQSFDDLAATALQQAFHPLTVESTALLALAKCAVPYNFGSRTPILSTTAAASALWLVAKGRVSLGSRASDGTWNHSRTIQPGGWLDLTSAWLGGMYVEAALAATETIVYKFRLDELDEICAKHPLLLRYFLCTLASSHKRALQVIRDLTQNSVLERLAGRLLDYAAHSQDGASIRLQQPKQALAAELGTSPESLSRAFAQLRSLGCISTDGRKFSVLNKPQLQGVANRKPEPEQT